MADQIVDKITVGIPSNELDIYVGCEKFKDEAELFANYAKRAEVNANISAVSAAESASEAKAWAIQHMGVWVNLTEPPEEGRADGTLWWQTNETQDTVEHIWLWNADDGGFLYPRDELYPSDDLYPTEGGAWRELKLDATCLK